MPRAKARAPQGVADLARPCGSAPLSAWFGMIVIVIYLVVALFAPWLAPYGEAEIVGERL